MPVSSHGTAGSNSKTAKIATQKREECGRGSRAAVLSPYRAAPIAGATTAVVAIASPIPIDVAKNRIELA